MMKYQSLCKLCNLQEADKKNSHIIPKFLGKGLYELTLPRHSLQLQTKTGKWRKTQSTPKENHLLCASCEKRFEIIETYFSKKITELHNFSNHADKFSINGGGGLLSWDELSPSLFRLFIYSIVWRCSASSLHDFQSFKLSDVCQEELRSALDKHLRFSQNELLEDLPGCEDLPSYHICMMKPIEKTSPPGGLYSVYSYSESLHLLMLVDFLIFFITDDKTIKPQMKPFSTQYHRKPVTGLMKNEHWIAFNYRLYNQISNLIAGNI